MMLRASAVLFVIAGLLGAETAALSGRVTSAEEGVMEGVLISARLDGSTITTTVVSDASGDYKFPASRMQPGHYALRIRAVGYELESPASVDVAAGKNTTAHLKLRKTANPAAQLSNAEWFDSFPGTEAQKASIRNCTHCHTVERIMRSHYTAETFVPVLQRMSTYPQLSFPMMVQKLVAPRIGGGEDPLEQKMDGWRRQAAYLSTLNLSSTDSWKYELHPHARPHGKATQVIYTEYDLPAKTRQPHDVIVDSKGMVWYADFGDQILGKLDPATAKVTEYKVPLAKPGAPTGTLALRFDQEENLWLGMQFQAAI
jgi:virginiamycin B lyase